MNYLFEKIKNKFFSAKDTVKDKIFYFYHENKKLALIIAGLILVILICLILLICMAGKKSKKTDNLPGEELILTENLVIPDGPELPRDYTTSRQTKEKWTDEEAESWFTVPGQKEIDSLATSNENLVNEIIGAAP